MRDEDHERFTRHWTQAQSSISGYVDALVPDPHVADDLLQDIAVALMRKFPEYDAQRPFIAWAMGIAKIQILTMRRDRARAAVRFRGETIESLAESWHEIRPEVDERRAALNACLGAMTGRNLELITLRYQQALAPQEIAARIGMASGAVRVALVRVRAALQACIERRLHAKASP